MVRYFNGLSIELQVCEAFGSLWQRDCSLSIELQVCEAWRKGRPCGEVCQWQRDL